MVWQEYYAKTKLLVGFWSKIGAKLKQQLTRR